MGNLKTGRTLCLVDLCKAVAQSLGVSPYWLACDVGQGWRQFRKTVQLPLETSVVWAPTRRPLQFCQLEAMVNSGVLSDIKPSDRGCNRDFGHSHVEGLYQPSRHLHCGRRIAMFPLSMLGLGVIDVLVRTTRVEVNVKPSVFRVLWTRLRHLR